jgi:Tol biopolymer transport system component
MTNEQRVAIDSVLRRIDVPAEPDDAFLRSSARLLRGRAQRARAEDRSPIRRLVSGIGMALGQLGARTTGQRATVVGLIALALLLALAALIAFVGASRQSRLGNGALVLEVNGALRAINLEDGSTRPISIGGDSPAHVSRSPDGRQIAYWRSDPGGDQLVVMNTDGTARRQVGADVPITAASRMAVWSPDSSRLAAEVEAGEQGRIVVVDVDTGRGAFVTSPAFGAQLPLWSPDGVRIAFNKVSAIGTDMAIVRADGAGETRVLAADLDGEVVSGTNSWSPDGEWIYFGTNRSLWRLNVATGKPERLTDRTDTAAAPALSPDGSRLSFILSTPVDWDLYIANPDGSDPHLLLRNARNNSWSADGKWILSRWRPPDQPGGLVLVSAAGDGFHLVVPAAEACPDRDKPCDLDWGQPRP